MTTVLKVFTRDLRRLWQTPKVWVIIIGVIITPALYAWFNIAAFWDPYGNTRNIDIAVVNQDTGADSSLTGHIDVGAQMVEQLSKNDQLGWRFMDADEADHQLKKGEVFASITVPPDFSSDFLSMFGGTYERPTLTYRVNEKLNAISPKISDQGASQIDTQITSTFKEQVASAVTTELRNAGGDIGDRLAETGGNTSDAFAGAARTMASARDEIDRVRQSIRDASPTIDATRDALGSVGKTLDDAGTALQQVQSVMTEVQKQVATFSDSATTAFADSTTALAEGTSAATGAVASVTGELERATSGLDGATRSLTGVVDQSGQAVSRLQALVDGAAPEIAGPLTDALNGLQERNRADRALLDDITGLQRSTADTVSSVNAAATALESATADTRDSAQALTTAVRDTLPALNRAVNRVNESAGSFAGTLQSQRTILDQSVGLLDGVEQQLGRADGVLGGFSDNLAGIEDGLNTARADVNALVAASGQGALGTVSNLDSVSISRFLASPAELDSHPVYPVAKYGSGMASLFTNLSLWIGAFMLMVIFRTEVDTAGLRKLTVAQAYLGRLLLLSVLALFQGFVVSVGDLVLGVQHVNPVIFVATCMLISVAYLSVIYGLITAFGHIGRGIAVVLAFIQIPGSSGMYPIEMTPDFFRAVYPFLPFTYGIDAMRETVGGFYGNHYWKAMGVLALMAFVAFVVGTFLRRNLSHVNMLVNRQLGQGGLIINEEVQVVGSSYRLSDAIRALRDRDAFRDEIDGRWRRLRENYPALLKITVGVGVVGVLVLGVLARVHPDQKAVIFGVVCLWILLVITLIAMLDYVKNSFGQAQELMDLPEEKLRGMVSGSAGAGSAGAGGAGAGREPRTGGDGE